MTAAPGAKAPAKPPASSVKAMERDFKNAIAPLHGLIDRVNQCENSNWKTVRSTCEPVVKEYEAKLKKLSEV